MAKGKHSEAEIIGALKQLEAGRTAEDVGRGVSRESLALPVDTSFASRRVTRELEAILAGREKPLAIRCDNGPEFTSRHFLALVASRSRSSWCTFNRGSRSRTGTWKVSTASCGMSA